VSALQETPLPPSSRRDSEIRAPVRAKAPRRLDREVGPRRLAFPKRAPVPSRSLSLPHALRVCSTSRARTLSVGAWSNSGQSDHRSIAASNACSAPRSRSAFRAATPACSCPAIIARSAAIRTEWRACAGRHSRRIPRGACDRGTRDVFAAAREVSPFLDPSGRGYGAPGRAGQVPGVQGPTVPERLQA